MTENINPANDLNLQSVEKYLGKESSRFRIEIFQTISSTNIVLCERAAQGAPEGTVLIAESQSHGKGRLKRKFFSPTGSGLYFSLLLRPKEQIENALFITPAAAVAVAQAIEAVSNREAKIKWVNDIFLDNRKVCGILTESSFNMEDGQMNYAVVGIGINVREPQGGFPLEIHDSATAIFPYDSATPELRSHLAAEVLSRFMTFYDALDQKTFLPEYRSRSLLTGKSIWVSDDRSLRKATALDIDDECRLIVRMEDGSIQPLSYGEVSIKMSVPVEKSEHPIKKE